VALSFLYQSFRRLLGLVRGRGTKVFSKDAEILVLCHQLAVLRRQLMAGPASAGRATARSRIGRRARAGAAWQERGLIFTAPAGAPIEPSSFSHAFLAMAQRAGLGRWHVHEARHTAASLMLAMGTKLEIVSRVLGHSSVTVTADVYSHLLGGEKRQAAAAMTAALLDRPGNR
jgi:integrase